jgi:predicted nucleotidyltransferase component of viral defense system
LIEKIRSIIQGGKSRDYYDVSRLLREHEFDMNAIDRAYEPELIFDADRLREAEGYWKSAMGELTKELPEFKEVVSELQIRLLFV